MTRSGSAAVCLSLCLWTCAVCGAAAGLDYPGAPPGEAVATASDQALILQNDALYAVWSLAEDHLRFAAFGVRPSSREPAAGNGEAFVIGLTDGQVLKASEFTVAGPPTVEKLTALPDARRLADRFGGVQVKAALVAPESALAVDWQAELRDGSNYVIQRVTLTAGENDVPLEAVTLVELDALDAKVSGVTQGSPVVAGELFFALEHPMSDSAVTGTRVTCGLRRGQALARGKTLTLSSVMGITPARQLRRGFLYYVERERAHPYRPFLHYNSWYDIAWGDRKFDEAQSIAAIETFCRELTAKRGVPMDSFVFDDGWDNNATLWQFHDGFPKGFTPLLETAASCGAALGVWLSPFGGYGEAREQRLQYGVEQGFEINRNGFSLAGPKYYERFHEICAEMIRTSGVNFFKFDGMGPGNNKLGGEEFLEDIEALMRLAGELRVLEPELYISATTGTWPTPYFLWHADSTWRSANDMDFSGKGSKRQQWINYRDTHTYRNVVRQGPLYPLNSLMTQGIVHAHHGHSAGMGEDPKDFADEVWSFFGSGTSLQELYIAPQLLTEPMWDILAAGAKWSRANVGVLVDTHWIGGDPGEHQVYGWAAWTPRKGILVLRNPDDQPAAITLDIREAFELPPDAATAYRLVSPGPAPDQAPELEVSAGEAHEFALEAFQTVVYDAEPVR